MPRLKTLNFVKIVINAINMSYILLCWHGRGRVLHFVAKDSRPAVPAQRRRADLGAAKVGRRHLSCSAVQCSAGICKSLSQFFGGFSNQRTSHCFCKGCISVSCVLSGFDPLTPSLHFVHLHLDMLYIYSAYLSTHMSHLCASSLPHSLAFWFELTPSLHFVHLDILDKYSAYLSTHMSHICASSLPLPHSGLVLDAQPVSNK